MFFLHKVDCVGFQDTLVPLPFTAASSITEMVNHTEGLPFGSTDCAAPMLWAQEKRRAYDVFIVFTDSETWVGATHPHQALVDYRKAMALPNAQLIVMGMTATRFTIADPDDAGMLDVVGLDAAVPELVRAFVMGEM